MDTTLSALAASCSQIFEFFWILSDLFQKIETLFKYKSNAERLPVLFSKIQFTVQSIVCFATYRLFCKVARPRARILRYSYPLISNFLSVKSFLRWKVIAPPQIYRFIIMCILQTNFLDVFMFANVHNANLDLTMCIPIFVCI